jgi:hypothetical protein
MAGGGSPPDALRGAVARSCWNGMAQQGGSVHGGVVSLSGLRGALFYVINKNPVHFLMQ